MSMSLTISQPTRTEFGNRYIHDFSPRISLAKSRLSPNPRVVSTPSPVTSLRVSATPNDSKMTTPHTHRGLPPPSAMALPDPTRSGQPSSLSQPLGTIPEPPRQWHGQEDSMRNWLAAKAEEDKRKQEEEKTRQETLRLEQRKIEQSMLRESLQGGVPPPMVPMIYAGMGGGSLVNVSLDWLQQYASQLQMSQQQILQQSPDMRRDSRLIGPPASTQYPVAQPSQQQVLASQAPAEPPPAQPGPIQTTFAAYPPVAVRQPTSAPRSATHTQLPRLTTNEMYVHQPPQAGPGSAHPLQQSQTIQDQTSSSSPIYFHHWVPPNETKGGNQAPQTPASKGEPSSAHPSSIFQDEFKDSPRKRKAQGAHERNPPPSTGPQYTSPSFSTTSSTSRRGGHYRSQSNASPGRDPDSRPESRRGEFTPSAQKIEFVQQGSNGSGAGSSQAQAPAAEREDARPASRARQEPTSGPSETPPDPPRS